MQFKLDQDWGIKLILKFTLGYYLFYQLLLGLSCVLIAIPFGGLVGIYGFLVTAFQYGTWRMFCLMKERGVSEFLIICYLACFPVICTYIGVLLHLSF